MARSRDTAPATADPTPPEAASGEIPHNPADNGQPAPEQPKKKRTYPTSRMVRLVKRLDVILCGEEDVKLRISSLKFLAESHGLTVVE